VSNPIPPSPALIPLTEPPRRSTQSVIQFHIRFWSPHLLGTLCVVPPNTCRAFSPSAPDPCVSGGRGRAATPATCPRCVCGGGGRVWCASYIIQMPAGIRAAVLALLCVVGAAAAASCLMHECKWKLDPVSCPRGSFSYEPHLRSHELYTYTSS
jgi:hypothetical protein